MDNIDQIAPVIAIVSAVILVTSVVVLIAIIKKPLAFSKMRVPITWQSATAVTVVAAIVLVFGIGVLSGWFDRYNQTETALTPTATPAPTQNYDDEPLQALADVQLKTLEEAVEMLEFQGMEVTIIEERSETVAAGFVISQDPDAGTPIESGMIVTIIVSIGDDYIENPTITYVSAGSRYTMAIDVDGNLWAWGRNKPGDWQGDDIETDLYSPVWIMDDVIAVSAGWGHTMAIRGDGSLWAWGLNDFGQIGDGTATIKDDFWNTIENNDRLSPVWIMDDVIAVSAGSTHTMAIRSDGSLWAWGNNHDGQLGDGTVTTQDRYGIIIENNNSLSPIWIMDDVVAVSASDGHTMAIKSDGSLWAWGCNIDGKLGDGTSTLLHEYGVRIIRNNNRRSPIRIMNDVVAVSAGLAHTMAIRSDGSLWAWGNNFYGQLGDGTAAIWDDYGNMIENNNRLSPIRIMDDVIAVSVGDGYTMAIRSDSSLWAWGRNWSGKLGDGTTTDRHTPVLIMDDMITVSLGFLHTMAVQNDGSLWAWGGNWEGQLGDGTTTDRHNPARVEFGCK